MKVVLFCGGLGTRIREYSESVPKPMIPVGDQPILCHVMDYYAQYGHRDYVLCLGYKAGVVNEFFHNHQPQFSSGMVVSGSGAKIKALREPVVDWRITMIDTGIWRNIGSRLWAVRDQVQDEEMFCANYSDGLTDMNLDRMVEAFTASDKLACFMAVRPPLTYHVADIAPDGKVRDLIASDRSEIWINGGFFLFKKGIFDYMRDGEELVVEPFKRLIAEDKLMAYKHEGFFRAMDTLRDRQVLEDMFKNGVMPWRAKAPVLQIA